LDLAPVKKTRLLAQAQAYSQLYYETRIKDIVEAEWPAERDRILEQKKNGEDMKDPPKRAPLWFRNKIAQLEFQTESDEIKDEVEKYRQSLLEDSEVEDAQNLGPDEAKRVAVATARAKYVR
jgi:tRNA(Ser,Leu) C12 N-acetylase TAN1